MQTLSSDLATLDVHSWGMPKPPAEPVLRFLLLIPVLSVAYLGAIQSEVTQRIWLRPPPWALHNSALLEIRHKMAKYLDTPSAKSAVLAIGIEYTKFQKRSTGDRDATRKSITTLVTSAFQAVFPTAQEGCSFQETASGLDVVFPSGILKSNLLAKFVPQLEVGLEECNNRGPSSSLFRLRVVFDVVADFGRLGTPPIAGRLLGSSFLRLFMAALPKERFMAVLLSDEFYHNTKASGRCAVDRELKRARVRTEENVAVTIWAYRYPVPEA